jgi:hypothetical protein
MKQAKVYADLIKHVSSYFSGHKIKVCEWTLGPILTVLPKFRILEISPGAKSPHWNYISLGAWEAKSQHNRFEFVIASPESNERMLELLAMTAYYHTKHALGLGHTFPIGEPWLHNSICDHILISLPYPYGQELAVLNLETININLYWLVPITKAERDYKISKGLDPLEELFENEALEYWNPDRESLL